MRNLALIPISHIQNWISYLKNICPMKYRHKPKLFVFYKKCHWWRKNPFCSRRLYLLWLYLWLNSAQINLWAIQINGLFARKCFKCLSKMISENYNRLQFGLKDYVSLVANGSRPWIFIQSRQVITAVIPHGRISIVLIYRHCIMRLFRSNAEPWKLHENS